MNICFFSGIIIDKPEFKFIINKKLNFKQCKNISIIEINLKLENETIIKIKGYDEIAEKCYRELKQGEYIFLYGKINSIYEIIIDYYEIIL